MYRILLLLLLPLKVMAADLQARQLIVVTTGNWQATQGQLQTLEQQGGHWRAGPVATPVSLGRSGLAWGLGIYPQQPLNPQKAEGDGKTPAGIFALGSAFGYAPTLKTALPYLATSASSYCMDVPASPYYNQLVDSNQVGQAAVAGSSEPLRLDLKTPGDKRYQEALVVLHNPANIKNAGSCIFLHVWKGPGETTAGCTAMAEPALQQLLGWLDPKASPLLVVMPKPVYWRLAPKLGLPRLPQ